MTRSRSIFARHHHTVNSVPAGLDDPGHFHLLHRRSPPRFPPRGNVDLQPASPAKTRRPSIGSICRFHPPNPRRVRPARPVPARPRRRTHRSRSHPASKPPGRELDRVWLGLIFQPILAMQRNAPLGQRRGIARSSSTRTRSNNSAQADHVRLDLGIASAEHGEPYAPAWPAVPPSASRRPQAQPHLLLADRLAGAEPSTPSILPTS